MRERDDLVERAALAVRARLRPEPPRVFLTLGSGLAGVAERIEDPIDIPLAAVPGVPVSRVPGHPGILRYGTISGITVLAQMGRIHLYEGYDAAEVSRMVEVGASLGADTYIVTAAVGGLLTKLVPGDLVVLNDHINLTGTSPLLGLLREGEPMFVDMGAAYDHELLDLATQVAEATSVRARTGVYAGLVGPAFETPAEVAMLRRLGADVVGMSVVNEVIAARARAMRVLGIATVTNVHRKGVQTSHEEVLEVGAATADALADLVLGVLARL